MSVVTAGVSDFDDFDPALASIMKSLAHWARGRGCEEDIEDALSETWIVVFESHINSLSQFLDQPTRLQLFLRRLFYARLRDLTRKRRPTQEISKLLARLVQREQIEFDEACAIITTNHRVSSSELKKLAARLAMRPRVAERDFM